MQMKFWQIAMIFGLAVNAFAQTDSKVEAKNLEAYYNGNYSGRKQFVFPARIGKFFPKVLLIKRTRKPSHNYREQKVASLAKAINFFDATEYVSKGNVSDRSWFQSIEVKGKTYIFSGESFGIETDAEIFNLFLKQANLKIESEKEAAELANLYFSITRGYFENRGKLILSGVEDVPLSYRKAKESETKRLQEIVAAPTSKVVGKNYEVELFTWEMALGEVKKWSFKIQPDAQIEVQSEIIGKL